MVAVRTPAARFSELENAVPPDPSPTQTGPWVVDTEEIERDSR
jgi:hypothetical protein